MAYQGGRRMKNHEFIFKFATILNMTIDELKKSISELDQDTRRVGGWL